MCARVRAKVGPVCQIVLMKIFPREESPTEPRRALINAANGFPTCTGREGGLHAAGPRTRE